MSAKPSVTFASSPWRSGTLSDWMIPPYVMIETSMPRALRSVYLSIAVPPMLAGRLPKLDWVTLSPPWWCPPFAPAGTASAPAASTATSRVRSVLERFGMTLPSVVGVCMSGRHQLQPRQLAERAPRLRVASRVQHLMVGPAEAQPRVHRRAHALVGPEPPVGHLEGRKLGGVEHLSLAHQQPEALAAERHERRQRSRAGVVLEQERRWVFEPSDSERALDQAHRPVSASQAPVALSHVAHQDRVGGEVHGVHLGELRVAE